MSVTTPRPRGRPQGGRAFDRSDIVEAALDAIAAGGFGGLSMRGVARSIGASLATVQRHFPTKDELWRGAIDHFFEGFQVPTVETAESALDDGIRELLDRGSDYPGLVAMLLTDRSPGHVERHRHIVELLASRQTSAMDVIDRQRASGVIRDIDGRALLLLVHLGIGGLVSASGPVRELYGFDLDDADDVDRLAASLADIIRLGLARR